MKTWQMRWAAFCAFAVSIWELAKKHWKAVVLVMAVIGSVIFAEKVYGIVRQSILGRVDPANASDFHQLDLTHIVAKDQSGQWQTVELGKDATGRQITVSDVKAVQLQDAKPAIVEMHNMAIGDI